MQSKKNARPRDTIIVILILYLIGIEPTILFQKKLRNGIINKCGMNR